MSRTDAQVLSQERPLKVFFSYAHCDERFRNELEKSLSFLKNSGAIQTWHDRRIPPGDDWAEAIDDHLREADIILLLVSADFASSRYCWSVETQIALERHRRGDAKVIPVMIRPVDPGWSETPLGRLQALPKGARPVTSWHKHDDAYADIAAGIRTIIDEWSHESASTALRGAVMTWSLELAGEDQDYPEPRIQSIASRLRKAASCLKIRYANRSSGSVILEFESVKVAFDILKSLYESGELAAQLGCDILALSAAPGAVLRIESHIVEESYRSSIHYLPDVFGPRTLEDGYPPLVQGMVIPLDNPLQIGWSLVTDGSRPTPTSEEQAELQSRLGRYLNTMLVLSGDHLNVDLNPLDPHCGLPSLLRHTDLGRDMLAQDVVLKHVVASAMHPSTERGGAFWSQADELIDSNSAFEACFRVWIIPGDVTVHERSEGRLGHVTMEKLGLKVLCDDDYRTLQRIQGGSQASGSARPVGRLLDLFQKYIVPVIQEEVSFGPRFGLLRQILSVLIMSRWIRESQLGELLMQARFLDSNTPERFGLVTVTDETLVELKQIYLRMFQDGTWTFARTRFDTETNLTQKRLLTVGGLKLS